MGIRVDEQVRAAMPERSVLLSASAGSGKTRALVDRIIHLLAAGALPGEIAAITFTEKAAAQMKDRLLSTLSDAEWDGTDVRELLGLRPGEGPRPVVKGAPEILAGLMARPDALKVSTIHAFCLGLLRRFPLEAGVPPEFGILDESEVPIRRDEAAGACLDAVLGSALEDDYWTLAGAGLGPDAVEDLLALALEKRSAIYLLAAARGGYGPMQGHFDAEAEAARGALSGARVEEANELAARMLKVLGPQAAEPLAGPLGALAGVEDIKGLAAGFARIKGLFYTRAGAPLARTPLTLAAAGELCGHAAPGLKRGARAEKARALKQTWDELYIRLRETVTALAGLCDLAAEKEAAAAFFRLYRAAEAAYTGANHTGGMLDYDDLEIYAHRLLSRPEGQAALIRMEQKILHYLVDEFQDTSELQWAIIETLNSETFSGQGAEGLRAPTVFAVGDKKQSIYRFRKADYRLMDALRRRMEEGIEPARRDFPLLDRNFRSAPEILSFVDRTVGPLLDDYRPALAERKDARGSVRAVAVSAEDEPGALADEVAAWLENGANLGDMAVLIRSRAALNSYERALRARGIGFRVVGGVGFFYQEEVQALVRLLMYLDDPEDHISLGVALKSPLFMLDDCALDAVFRSEEPLYALAEAAPRAHGLLARWKALAGTVPVGGLLGEIVRGAGALPRFGRSGGPAAVMNVEKLVETAREFDRRGGGLPDFVLWVKAYRDSSDMAVADVELPAQRDFLSVMTVHAAKGLEFPVVFLPGLARGTVNRAEALLTGRDGHGRPLLAVRTGTLVGDGTAYARMREKEAEEREKEAARLLYVAMTRARDHLVLLTGDGRKADKGSWLSLMEKAAPGIRDIFESPARSARRSWAAGGKEGRAEPGRGGPMPRAENLKPLPGPRGVRFVAPSETADGQGLLSEGASPDAALRGTIIHGCIEAFGRDGAYDAVKAARAADGFSGLGKKAGAALLKDVEGAMSRLLADGDIRRLLAPGAGKYRELPLLLLRDGEVVGGTADLVVVEGGAAVVVDFKTGLAGAGADAVAGAYGRQLGYYCEAVKEAFGLSGAKGRLLLVDRAEVLDVCTA